MRCLTLLFGGLLLASSSGCQTVSQAAYRVGQFLDPSLQITEPCACKYAGSGHSPEVIPPQADEEIAATSHAAPAPEQLGQFEATLSGLKQETESLRERVRTMEDELADRTNAVIETRAEFQRAQAQIESIRRDVAGWHQHVSALRQRMQARDEQRLAHLAQLNATVEKLLLQYEPPASDGLNGLPKAN